MCDPYDSTKFNVSFPVNSDLYRSLKHEIESTDNVEALVYLTYRIDKVQKDDSTVVNLLSGYLHGSVLFYNIDMLYKYTSMIRPAIGDIIAIDFPDDKN